MRYIITLVNITVMLGITCGFAYLFDSEVYEVAPWVAIGFVGAVGANVMTKEDD